MHLWLLVAGAITAAVGSLFFSTLTYALRELSRARLTAHFEQSRGAGVHWVEPTFERRDDLIFVTAVLRLFANILVLIAILRILYESSMPLWGQYLAAVLLTGVVLLFASVAIPHALARHGGEGLVAQSVRFLHAMRYALLPATKLTRWIDNTVKRAFGVIDTPQSDQVEQEIMSAVEEGENQGIVDEQEREMIESVIQFRATTAGQIMTPRPEIVGLELGVTLAHVKLTLEESGHSRLPVYSGTLDKIVGVLYARDLLKHLGQPPEIFDIRSAMRPAVFVPETKPLRDLLTDFKLQKVHIAIVADEYGGTSGLVTIEDILEELVGDISDEHEPAEPAMLHRIDDNTWEADARVYVDELNRVVGLSLPEDAGYDTLGGFVSNTYGSIPQKGATFDHDSVKYTILDAEPRKVNRLRLEIVPQLAQEPAPTSI